MAKNLKAGSCGSILLYDKTQTFLELRTVADDYKAGPMKHTSPDFVTSYLFATMVRQLAKRMEELF
jgi:hypothetical protein